MKKSVCIILSVLMLLSVIAVAPVSVNAYTSGDYGYTLSSSGNATIYDYYGSKGNITIPAKLDGHKVTAIAARAFTEHYLNKVVISKGIKKIGNSAFEACHMSSITLPSTITTIEFDAFNENDLETVTLPEKALNLGEGIFDYNLKLKSVTLPSKLTKIPARCFAGCWKLKTIKFPKALKSIGKTAFANCRKLETVKFPSKLTKIGENAFDRCEILKTIKFNEGLKTIGKEAFEDCYALEKVTLPYSLTELGEDAFCNCTAMKSVTIRDKVKKIGSHAFGYYNEVMGDDELMYFELDNFTVKAYKGSEGAKYASDNGFTLKTMKKPTKVKLNKKTKTLAKGKTFKLKATLTPKTAVTLLTWKSSNKKVATVTQKGKVKAKKKGTAVITVKTHNGKKAKCKIKVN